jgi:hypothetical protein
MLKILEGSIVVETVAALVVFVLPLTLLFMGSI